MPNLSTIPLDLITRFYIDGRSTRRAVALRWRIFKRKKGFANLSLGLIYHSKALPQPPSRDTIPLRYCKKCSTNHRDRQNMYRRFLYYSGHEFESKAWLPLRMNLFQGIIPREWFQLFFSFVICVAERVNENAVEICVIAKLFRLFLNFSKKQDSILERQEGVADWYSKFVYRGIHWWTGMYYFFNENYHWYLKYTEK
jgi:hypothetical protein